MVATEQQRELKPTPEAEALYRRWVSHMNEEFTRHEVGGPAVGDCARMSCSRCTWGGRRRADEYVAVERAGDECACRRRSIRGMPRCGPEYYDDVDC